MDAIFRRGKRHSNYGQDVAKIIKAIVNLIRTRYDATVPIIFGIDSGFLDKKNFALFDQLKVGFLATGKTFDAVKETVAAIPRRGISMDSALGTF